MIDFDTMDIKLLDERGQDILDKPVEELEIMAVQIAEDLRRQEEDEEDHENLPSIF